MWRRQIQTRSPPTTGLAYCLISFLVEPESQSTTLPYRWVECRPLKTWLHASIVARRRSPRCRRGRCPVAPPKPRFAHISGIDKTQPENSCQASRLCYAPLSPQLETSLQHLIDLILSCNLWLITSNLPYNCPDRLTSSIPVPRTSHTSLSSPSCRTRQLLKLLPNQLGLNTEHSTRNPAPRFLSMWAWKTSMFCPRPPSSLLFCRRSSLVLFAASCS